MPPSATIGDEVDWATRRLRSVGHPEPRRNALELWAVLAGSPPGEAYLRRDDAADAVTSRDYRRAVERLGSGEPFSYVVGRAAFRTLDLLVDRRALIPRPETEGLVELVLRWAESRFDEREDWGAVADIGTGSGCVALSLAVEGRFGFVLGTDESGLALEVARANVAEISPPVPVFLLRSSGLAGLRRRAFNVIVSNPPYLTDAELSETNSGVRDYEPETALAAGHDGMKVIDELLEGADQHLLPGGLLAIEVDCRRADHTLELAESKGWRDAKVENDAFGRPRFLISTRG